MFAMGEGLPSSVYACIPVLCYINRYRKDSCPTAASKASYTRIFLRIVRKLKVWAEQPFVCHVHLDYGMDMQD